MVYESKKVTIPARSSEEMKRIIEKNRVSKEELNKALDGLVAKHKSAIKELAKK